MPNRQDQWPEREIAGQCSRLEVASRQPDGPGVQRQPAIDLLLAGEYHPWPRRSRMSSICTRKNARSHRRSNPSRRSGESQPLAAQGFVQRLIPLPKGGGQDSGSPHGARRFTPGKRHGEARLGALWHASLQPVPRPATTTSTAGNDAKFEKGFRVASLAPPQAGGKSLPAPQIHPRP